MPLPGVITPLPANGKVRSYIPRNAPFCSFTSFLAFALRPYTSKSDSWKDLISFMLSFKSSFENTNVVVPNPTFSFD